MRAFPCSLGCANDLLNPWAWRLDSSRLCRILRSLIVEWRVCPCANFPANRMTALPKLEVLDPPADSRHRFPSVRYRDLDWDLTYLDSFAFKADIGFEVTVVVIFSCHCFSHSFRCDTRSRAEIPEAEIYRDEKEARVLDPLRYHLSQTLLRELIVALPSRRIIVANVASRNFVTWEVQAADGKEFIYAVFFDVEKDQRRRQRLIL